MRCLRVAILLGSAMLLPVQGMAAQETDDAYAPLAGEWSGGGTLMGRDAHFTMCWAPALDGTFYRLDFQNAFVVDGARRPVLQAVAYYQTTGEPRVGTWVDARGVILDLEITAANGQLTVVWTGARERGESTYRVDGDELIVTDRVLRDGEMRPFAQAVLQRSAASSTCAGSAR